MSLGNPETLDNFSNRCRLPTENTERSRVCFSLDISILEQCHLRDLCLCKHSAYFLYVQLPTETSVTVLCFIELVHATVIQPSGTHLMRSKEQPVPQQLEKPETEMRCWAGMADKSEIKSASKSSLMGLTTAISKWFFDVGGESISGLIQCVTCTFGEMHLQFLNYCYAHLFIL